MGYNMRIKEYLKAFYVHIKHKRVTRERVELLEVKGRNSWLESEVIRKVRNKYFSLIFTKEDSEIGVMYTNMLGAF